MADIRNFRGEMEQARAAANRSPNKFITSQVHDILADWLDDHDDPRSILIRKRMKSSQAEDAARKQTDSKSFGSWPPIEYTFQDGSQLIVIPHGLMGRSINTNHVNVHNRPDWQTSVMHVRWQKIIKGLRLQYDTIMTKKEFQDWIRSFPDEERQPLLVHFQNQEQTAKFDESKSFDSFSDFLKNEMAGTGAIYDGTKSPDFQWWGAPESMRRPKRKNKKR